MKEFEVKFGVLEKSVGVLRKSGKSTWNLFLKKGTNAADWLAGLLSDLQPNWPAYWETDWPTVWLVGFLTWHWLTDWLTGWMANRPNDWLSDLETEQLAGALLP